jgi:hypothetical protein
VDKRFVQVVDGQLVRTINLRHIVQVEQSGEEWTVILSVGESFRLNTKEAQPLLERLGIGAPHKIVEAWRASNLPSSK